jgi:hypothetical protein
MSAPLDVGAIVGELGLLRAESRRDIEMLKVVDEREQGIRSGRRTPCGWPLLSTSGGSQVSESNKRRCD